MFGRQVGDGVGLDVEILGSGRRLDSHNRRKQRGCEASSPHGERRWNTRQKGDLVLPFVVAASVEAPDLRVAGAVSERFERDGGFDRPAAGKPSDRKIPDRVPVAVVLPLVGALSVEARAEGIDRELERVAPVVKRVEGERSEERRVGKECRL